MGFEYGINRLLGLQGSNFAVFDMDVKDDRIVYTIKHREPAQFICKSCGAHHDSYHDKQWVDLEDLPLGPRKVIWRVERMRILCHCQMGYRVELMDFKSHRHQLTQRYVDYIEYTLCTKMLTVADTARLFNCTSSFYPVRGLVLTNSAGVKGWPLASRVLTMASRYSRGLMWRSLQDSMMENKVAAV